MWTVGLILGFDEFLVEASTDSVRQLRVSESKSQWPRFSAEKRSSKMLTICHSSTVTNHEHKPTMIASWFVHQTECPFPLSAFHWIRLFRSVRRLSPYDASLAQLILFTCLWHCLRHYVSHCVTSWFEMRSRTLQTLLAFYSLISHSITVLCDQFNTMRTQFQIHFLKWIEILKSSYLSYWYKLL